MKVQIFTAASYSHIQTLTKHLNDLIFNVQSPLTNTFYISSSSVHVPVMLAECYN